jgi:hypothetical protein
MPSLLSVLSIIILGGITCFPSASALPYASSHEIRDIAATDLPIIGQADLNILAAQRLNLKIGTAAKGASCPATNNGANQNYVAHSYTAGQAKAAMLAGANLAIDKKTIGGREYSIKCVSSEV